MNYDYKNLQGDALNAMPYLRTCHVVESYNLTWLSAFSANFLARCIYHSLPFALQQGRELFHVPFRHLPLLMPCIHLMPTTISVPPTILLDHDLKSRMRFLSSIFSP